MSGCRRNENVGGAKENRQGDKRKMGEQLNSCEDQKRWKRTAKRLQDMKKKKAWYGNQASHLSPSWQSESLASHALAFRPHHVKHHWPTCFT